MHVVVWLPGVLRELAKGARTVEVELAEPATVRDLLDCVGRRYPAVERRIRDETGTLRPHVNVFVGEVSVRDRHGLDESVVEGTEVSVIPAVSGG